VRQTALHIRQAVVYDDSHGFPTGLGQIIVKNEDEAWRTYRKYQAAHLYPTPSHFNRPPVNKRLGRPKPSRHTLANKHTYQTYRRPNQKPPSNGIRLYLRPLDAASRTRKHGNPFIPRLPRVSLPPYLPTQFPGYTKANRT
jgi:hypothetical protein